MTAYQVGDRVCYVLRPVGKRAAAKHLPGTVEKVSRKGPDVVFSIRLDGGGCRCVTARAMAPAHELKGECDGRA